MTDSTLPGVGGIIVGSAAGIIRSSPPVLFAAISGVQCFALGTTYWGTRSFILRAWDTDSGSAAHPSQSPRPPRERLSASALAGGVAGSGVGLLTRGPRNAIPGGIMFALFGGGCQYVYEALDRPAEEGAEANSNFLQRVAARKWSPFSILSDEDYEKMLRERMLKVDVEIALIDDRIADLETKRQVVDPKEGKQPVLAEKGARK